jgi:hypothetical protein
MGKIRNSFLYENLPEAKARSAKKNELNYRDSGKEERNVNELLLRYFEYHSKKMLLLLLSFTILTEAAIPAIGHAKKNNRTIHRMPKRGFLDAMVKNSCDYLLRSDLYFILERYFIILFFLSQD